ncbi:MAG: type II toxin-antitoxin system VapC family toxin [Chloroflexi bacterium]|nr:type II toxin-antitoxin system VapC family toxin [Chloroflexota bacterium]
MRCLLDTHAFLWWIADDPRLTERVRAILRDAEQEIFFSAASAWEIAIKTRLGHLDFDEDVAEFIPRQLLANGFSPLPVQVRHALRVHSLPLVHRDPFDRLLVAQALLEDLPILTADPIVAQYPVDVLW